MISNDLRALVSAASAHAAECNDKNGHAVASALLTRSGHIVLGLNSHHSLGGECGEFSALSDHASTYPNDQVTAVVAVHGRTGQVMSPCGKCRQILSDLDPAIQCVVRSSSGLEAVSVATLLPFAYDRRSAELPQKIYMWEGYEASIRDGSKRQTIRIDDPFRPGPAQLVFEKESGDIVTIDATVTSVTTTRCRDLTERHARCDGFASLTELHLALRKHYPELAENDVADVVSFELHGESNS